MSPGFLCFCQFALQDGKARAIMSFPPPSTGRSAVLSCNVLWGNKVFPNPLHCWTTRCPKPSSEQTHQVKGLIQVGSHPCCQDKPCCNKRIIHEYRLLQWQRACKIKVAKGKLCETTVHAICSLSQLLSHLRTCCYHYQNLFSLQAFDVTLSACQMFPAA